MKQQGIFVKLFKEWMRKTTGHAMANIIETNLYSLKAIWLISWVIGFACTVYFITLAFIAYFNYSVVSRSEIINERPMLFPKVTFCNIDPFSSNYSIAYLADLIRSESSYADKLFQSGASSDLELVNYFILNEENLLETAKLSVRSENETTKISLGHNKTEFIHYCSFNNVECSIENDFDYEYNEKLGNCYSFNYDRNKIKQSFNPGKLIIL